MLPEQGYRATATPVAFGPDTGTGQFDVVVVGGGITGWIAARRSQQLGARVALLERGPTGPGWGSLQNAFMAQGRIHASYLNPLIHTPDELYAQLWKKTDGQVSSEVVRDWAENSRRGVEFVLAEGGEVTAVGGPEYMQLALTNVPINTRMMETFRAGGGTFQAHARAVKLEMLDGAVAGIWYERPDGSRHLVRARSVILACSGFQSDRGMVERYITRHAHRVIDSNGANQYAVGDGLKMAQEVGAKLVQLDAFYGNVQIRDWCTDPPMYDAPSPEEVMDVAMVVDQNGERIGDEAIGQDEWSIIEFRLARPLAARNVPGDSWLVFDDDVWRTDAASDRVVRQNRGTDVRGYIGISRQTLNPYIVERGGTLLRADSIGELAIVAGIPAARLEASVAAFNRFATSGEPLDPLRTGRAKPIRRAPFYAIPLAIGIFFTMGGPLVGRSGQVLDERERPIPGLYAAGTAMGGLQGGPRNGYAGGTSSSMAFGLLTAEHAVGAATGAVAAAV
jgi:fumarate reductase flavoprotein subunit